MERPVGSFPSTVLLTMLFRRSTASVIVSALFAANAGVAVGESIRTATLATQESSLLIKNGERIAFLGDSITAGGAGHGGYCRMVVHGLKSKGIRTTPIFAGIPGNTSADMLERLESDVLKHKTDWVILAAGVNDVWHGDPTVKIGVFQPKPGMGVKLPDYRKNVTTIVDRCVKAGAKVILTTITPIREEPDFKLNLTARDYNAFLRQLATDRNLPLADLNRAMFSEIAKGARLTSDGVHPLESGHRVMAKGLLETIGYTGSEASELEAKWKNAPHILILGDRQTTSGGRTGGWIQLLLEGLNSGQDMVTHQSHAQYRKEVTLRSLLGGLDKKLEESPQTIIFQAPKDDAVAGTSLEDYRKAIEELKGASDRHQARLVLTTIAQPEEDPSGELRSRLEPYNELIRKHAKENKIALADIARAMDEAYEKEANLRLMFDGHRFNRKGSILIVEALLEAMDCGAVITPQLRQIWNDTPAYFRRYQ